MGFAERGFFTLHDIDRMHDDVLQAQKIVKGAFKNDKTGIGDMFRFKQSGNDAGSQSGNQAMYQFVPMKDIKLYARHFNVPTTTITGAGQVVVEFPTGTFTSQPVVNVLLQSNSHNYVPIVQAVDKTGASITFMPSRSALVLSGSITPQHLLHLLAFGKGGV